MILQWNIRGLQANREELDLLSFDLDPTVICLQETFLKENKNTNFKYLSTYHRYASEVNGIVHGGSSVLVKLSPRLLAEPWRQEDRCVRAGENESPRRLSSAVSPVYSTRSNMHFDTMRSIQRSFIHSTTMSLLYRVPAVFAPRDSEPTRRGDRLLSHIEMSGHENSNSKEEQE